MEIPEFLEALGLAASADEMTMNLRFPNGSREDVKIAAVRYKNLSEVFDGANGFATPEGWAGPPGMRALWLKRRHEAYWFQYLPDRRTMYAQINQSFEDPESPYNAKRNRFGEFLDGLFAAIESNRVDRLVRDLRHNPGGEEPIRQPLVHHIIRSERINTPGRLFVITGRLTESAPVAWAAKIEGETMALFAGEETASALMGMAIRDGFIKDDTRTLGEFYNLKSFANFSPKKSAVALKNLLTMSSAFLGSDMNAASPGNEENMYPTPNWVKFALDLPMDDAKENGRQWDYFTAGVVLLGDILDKSVPGGLERYADKALFKPLGITRYQWQYTPQKVVNTAGGLQMSSLDNAKFGQLYKNGGLWNGAPVLPKQWVEKSFQKYLEIPNNENAFYGLLFWTLTYKVNGHPYETFYCTGNGGNKIFVFIDQPLVIVITATAYGKPYMHPRVDKMMEGYILPAVLR